MGERYEYDAVIIGSGPNGLAAAILLQQNGVKSLLLEGKDKIGGGLATEQITIPGFYHDVAAAVHPMAAASPFFQSLPLSKFGLKFINPPFHIAHPFDDGSSATVSTSLEDTASRFGTDKDRYWELMSPIVEMWPSVRNDLLGPLVWPKEIIKTFKFGTKALLPITRLSRRFIGQSSKGLFAGLATHTFGELNAFGSSAIPLVMLANAHIGGWPVISGGSVALADALGAYFKSIGGTIQTGHRILDAAKLPPAKAYLFDLTPKQLLEMRQMPFSEFYKSQLSRYRYGPGVYKVDFALETPIPFAAKECQNAGTIHLGNTFQEIADGEILLAKGRLPSKPFTLVTQASVFDGQRAPDGKHTAYAYCHVPNGSTTNMGGAIIAQIERFAPGFKKTIIAKHEMNTQELQKFNPNLIGGDINSGSLDVGQLFARPVFRPSPYRTSAFGWYICSASTPPGSGVHGMCGYHAAKTALKDVFKIDINEN